VDGPRQLRHTEIYLSYKPRAEAAKRLAQAFEAVPANQFDAEVPPTSR